MNQLGSLGAVAQLGERCVRNAEVEGSTPFRSTLCKSCRNKCLCYRPMFGRAAFSSEPKRNLPFWSPAKGDPHHAEAHQFFSKVPPPQAERSGNRHTQRQGLSAWPVAYEGRGAGGLPSRGSSSDVAAWGPGRCGRSSHAHYKTSSSISASAAQYSG